MNPIHGIFLTLVFFHLSFRPRTNRIGNRIARLLFRFFRCRFELVEPFWLHVYHIKNMNIIHGLICYQKPYGQKCSPFEFGGFFSLFLQNVYLMAKYANNCTWKSAKNTHNSFRWFNDLELCSCVVFTFPHMAGKLCGFIRILRRRLNLVMAIGLMGFKIPYKILMKCLFV